MAITNGNSVIFDEKHSLNGLTAVQGSMEQCDCPIYLDYSQNLPLEWTPTN